MSEYTCTYCGGKQKDIFTVNCPELWGGDMTVNPTVFYHVACIPPPDLGVAVNDATVLDEKLS